MNSSKQTCFFEHESQVCVSAVHPDMMYNHDNWDFICYFGGHFFGNFEREKLKIELGMGQIRNQHIRIVWKQLHDKFYYEMPYKL